MMYTSLWFSFNILSRYEVWTSTNWLLVTPCTKAKLERSRRASGYMQRNVCRAAFRQSSV